MITLVFKDPVKKEVLGGLQGHTLYVIEVTQFGQTHEIRKRFHEFNTLYEGIITTNHLRDLMPPLPQKQMWGSLDSNVVNQRKPQLEAVIKAMLAQRECYFVNHNALLEFLEIPPASMRVLEYLEGETPSILPLLKLVEVEAPPFHLFEHPETVRHMTEELSKEENPEEDELLRALSLLLAKRKVFRQHFYANNGLNRLFLKIAQYAVEFHGPRDTVKHCFNVIIQAEGDEFPSLFQNFLAEKKGLKLLLAKVLVHLELHEFLTKLLWFSFDKCVQQVCWVEGDEGELPRQLWQSLFTSKSPNARFLTGLLLSVLILNNPRSVSDRVRKIIIGLEGLLQDFTQGKLDQPFVEALCKSQNSLMRFFKALQSGIQDLQAGNQEIQAPLSFLLFALVSGKPKKAALLSVGYPPIVIPLVHNLGFAPASWYAARLLVMAGLLKPNCEMPEVGDLEGIRERMAGTDMCLSQEIQDTRGFFEKSIDNIHTNLNHLDSQTQSISPVQLDSELFTGIFQKVDAYQQICATISEFIAGGQQALETLKTQTGELQQPERIKLRDDMIRNLEEAEIQGSDFVQKYREIDSVFHELEEAVHSQKIRMREMEATAENQRDRINEGELKLEQWRKDLRALILQPQTPEEEEAPTYAAETSKGSPTKLKAESPSADRLTDKTEIENAIKTTQAEMMDLRNSIRQIEQEIHETRGDNMQLVQDLEDCMTARAKANCDIEQNLVRRKQAWESLAPPLATQFNQWETAIHKLDHCHRENRECLNQIHLIRRKNEEEATHKQELVQEIQRVQGILDECLQGLLASG